MIIDNRTIASEQVVSLDVILQTMPQLPHVPVQHIIMILPTSIAHQTNSMGTQKNGDIYLHYVDNLTSAIETLSALDDSSDWTQQITNFFTSDITS